MKELILGPIPSTYDPDTHQIFFPGSALPETEKLLRGEFRFLNYDFTKDDYSIIQNQTLKMYFELCEQFAKYLNIQNNTNYSYRFWEILIGDWLIFNLTKIYEYKRRFEIIAKGNDVFKVNLLKLSDPNQTFFDTQTSYNQASQVSAEFNHYLMSISLRLSNIKNWKFEDKDFSFRFSSNKFSSNLSFKQKVLSLLKNSQRIQVIFGFNPLHTLILQFALFLNRFKSPNQINISHTEAETSPSENEINFFIKELKVLLPDEYRNLSTKIPKKPRYSKGFYFSDNIKSPSVKDIHLALMRETGVSIYLSQHGSGYGDFYVSVKNTAFDMSRFGFISWGLPSTEKPFKNVISLPSPMLSKLEKQVLKSKNKNFIALVSTAINGYPFSTSSGYDANFFLDYVNKIETILRSINSDVRKQFYYRPRLTHREYTFDLFGYITKKFPEVPILSGDLQKMMPNACLLILTDPGSVLHKCLAANIPFIICWNRKAWIMNDRYEQHLDKLGELDIFFTDATKATAKLNEIVDNIDAWWADPRRKAVIQDFKKDFAPTSRHYFLDWFKAFYRLPAIKA
jgi:putative transferase (TIGR04331 family)